MRQNARPPHIVMAAEPRRTQAGAHQLGADYLSHQETWAALTNDLCYYRNRPLAFLGRYIARHRFLHGIIVLAVLGAVTFSVSTQYGVKLLVDSLSTTNGPNNGPWTAFAVLGFFIAADNLLWRVASWNAAYAFVSVAGELRSELFRHLTGHAESYFASRLPGVLTSRITATSNAAFQVENMFIWNVMPPCVATVGAIVFLAMVSVKMALALVVIAGAVIVLMFRIAAAGRPLHHAFADRAAVVDGEMIDVIGNITLVRSFGAIDREHVRFDATVDDESKARRRSLLYLERLRLLHALIVVVTALGLLAWSITLWQNKQATAGDVVLVCTLGISVLSATRDLAVALVDVTQHMARLSEALSTLLSPHEMREPVNAGTLVPKGARVTFEGVSFRYPEGKQVFEGLSLDIEAGQRVGLVGPSGGGKSTLVALLQRFYHVQSGSILIDGQPIAGITEASLRQTIALVPQDTAMLNRTLIENIRYGRPDASDEEVWEAAIAARCRPFIETLPQGLETVVGDRGLNLSGGQRQRIAIARAFLMDAPLLILDEATSALDTESEDAIREALERLMAGRTVITIAHRLSTLRNFDRILVLSSGAIAEDGAPEALMQSEGIYHGLVNMELSRLAEQTVLS